MEGLQDLLDLLRDEETEPRTPEMEEGGPADADECGPAEEGQGGLAEADAGGSLLEAETGEDELVASICAGIIADLPEEHRARMLENVKCMQSPMKFGSLFSGCDLAHKAMKTMVHQLAKLSGHPVDVQHEMAVECVRWKRKFIKDY